MTPRFANAIMSRILNDVYLSLHSGDPGVSGENELSAGAYRRQQLSLSQPDNAVRSNMEVINFPMLPAGTVTHIGIWDRREGGTLLWSGPLDEPRGLEPNFSLFFQAGQLTVGLLPV